MSQHDEGTALPGGGDPAASAAPVRVDISHHRVEALLSGLFERVDLTDRVVARCASVESPLGEAVVAWTDRGVSRVRLRRPGLTLTQAVDHQPRPVLEADEAPGWLREAMATLDAPSLPVDWSGVRGFQLAVLEAARSIPRGETRSYGWIAGQIGKPGAVRAVGTALGRNPVPLLVPCHRVVRSDGTVGQYIFGEPAKRSLLAREGAVVA